MRPTLERVVEVWAIMGGCLLLLIVFGTTFNIGAYTVDAIARVWGGTVPALIGYEDSVTLTISAAALMLFPYCQLRHGHVSVDFFVEKLPPSLQRRLEVASLATMALLILFLLYWMVIGTLETRSDNVLSPILGWLQWPFYLPGLVSLALWFAVVAVELIDRVRRR